MNAAGNDLSNLITGNTADNGLEGGAVTLATIADASVAATDLLLDRSF